MSETTKTTTPFQYAEYIQPMIRLRTKVKAHIARLTKNARSADLSAALRHLRYADGFLEVQLEAWMDEDTFKLEFKYVDFAAHDMIDIEDREANIKWLEEFADLMDEDYKYLNRCYLPDRNYVFPALEQIKLAMLCFIFTKRELISKGKNTVP